MNKIFIKSIELKNFCGITSGKREFPEIDYLEAEFGAGKSSFYHGYQWCLGLPTDFEPKIGGKKIKGLETSVTITLNKDGLETTFTRTAKQSWKSDGDTERFDKYGYKYFVDGIELKAKQYGEKVLSYFNVTAETELSILLDTQYFNSTAEPKWNAEKRRAFLFDKFKIAEKTEELAKLYPDIYPDLYQTKVSQEVLRKDLKRRHDEIFKQVSSNNGWIDGLMTELAQLTTIDFDSLKAKKETLWAKLNELQTQTITEASKAEIDKKYAEINAIHISIQKETADYQRAVAENEKKIFESRAEIAKLTANKKLYEDKIRLLDSDYEDLTIEKDELESTTFSDSKCPTCGRKLPEKLLQGKTEAFEKSKGEKLGKINSQTAANRAGRTTALAVVQDTTQKISALQSVLEGLQNNVPIAPNFDLKRADIKKIELDIEMLKAPTTQAAMSNANAINQLRSEIDEVSAELAKETRKAQVTERIKALRANNLELANADKQILTKSKQLDEFADKEVQLADRIINSVFGGAVKFNFFEELGGTSERGFKKTCIATMGGIAYDNLSGGQQILCDYLTNVVLRKILNVEAPLWVDEICRITNNKELIGNVLTPTANPWQTVVLVTKDNAKLPVVLVKNILQNT